VKKVVELLEKLGKNIDYIIGDVDPEYRYICDEVIDMIHGIMAELQTPRWYTPEQWKRRTGEPWPDNGAVYVRQADGSSSPWIVKQYLDVRVTTWLVPVTVICATEAGPPPDDWHPKEKGA
jgi:hypothetical protein